MAGYWVKIDVYEHVKHVQANIQPSLPNKKIIIWYKETINPEPTRWRHLGSWPIIAQGHGGPTEGKHVSTLTKELNV